MALLLEYALTISTTTRTFIVVLGDFGLVPLCGWSSGLAFDGEPAMVTISSGRARLTCTQTGRRSKRLHTLWRAMESLWHRVVVGETDGLRGSSSIAISRHVKSINESRFARTFRAQLSSVAGRYAAACPRGWDQPDPIPQLHGDGSGFAERSADGARLFTGSSNSRAPQTAL